MWKALSKVRLNSGRSLDPGTQGKVRVRLWSHGRGFRSRVAEGSPWILLVQLEVLSSGNEEGVDGAAF